MKKLILITCLISFSIKSQNKIGSDIAMIFDCLIDIKDSKEKQINSINFVCIT